MYDSTNQSDRLGLVRSLLIRYRWRFTLAMLFAAVVVLVTSLFLPRKFEAEATFERRQDLVMDELSSRGRVSTVDRLLRRTAKADLAGRPALMRVIEELELGGPDGAAGTENARRELLLHLRRNLRVTIDLATPNLERVRVTLVDDNPARARAVVNRLVEDYIADNEKKWQRSLVDAEAFFREQRAISEVRIDELEAERVKFELENAELLPDESGSLQTRIGETEAQLLTARQEKEAADHWVKTLRDQLAEKLSEPDTMTSLTMGANPQVSEIDAKLGRYRAELDQLVTIRRMTDKHPMVKSLRSKIEELVSLREALPAEVVNERRVTPAAGKTELEIRLAEAETQAKAAASSVEVAETQLAKLKAVLVDMYPARSAYRRLERSIIDAQRQIDFWDDNLRRVTMAMAAEVGSHGVTLDFTHPCGELSVPSSPDLMQVLFAAVLMGIAAGVLTLLVSDRTNRTFANLNDPARDLGLPLLGATGELITARAQRWRAFVSNVVYPVCVLLLVGVLFATAYSAYVVLRTAPGEGGKWHETLHSLIGGEVAPIASLDESAEE